eukprot:3025951-Rhodomonas_salina.4
MVSLRTHRKPVGGLGKFMTSNATPAGRVAKSEPHLGKYELKDVENGQRPRSSRLILVSRSLSRERNASRFVMNLVALQPQPQPDQSSIEAESKEPYGRESCGKEKLQTNGKSGRLQTETGLRSSQSFSSCAPLLLCPPLRVDLETGGVFGSVAAVFASACEMGPSIPPSSNTSLSLRSSHRCGCPDAAVAFPS